MRKAGGRGEDECDRDRDGGRVRDGDMDVEIVPFRACHR